MKYFIKLTFILIAFLTTKLLIAAPVILKPVTAPAPTEFSTVNGVIGLNSEPLSGGTISIHAGSYSQTIPLETNGDFNLTVAANSSYTIRATLDLGDTLPGVAASFKNFPALAQGETQVLDLRRPSGHLLGKVNIIGGSAQNISIFANATVTTNGITEQYNANDYVNITVDQAPEVLLTFPANIASTVSGQVQITSLNGCDINESLPPQTITLDDRASGTTLPKVISWTIDVSNVSCNTGSINGVVRLDGIDSPLLLNKHQLSFIGPQFINLFLPTFGTYKVDSLAEGEYGISQTSFFNEPYSTLSYPYKNIVVSGDTVFNTIYPVGTSHGMIQLLGDWNYSQTTAATIEARGSLPGSTSDSLSAEDTINSSDGSFDFILINGDWQADRYEFDFESNVNARTNSETLKIQLLQDSMLNKHSIVESGSVNLAPLSLSTAMAQVDFLVEQSPGQSPITIERLYINGGSTHTEPDSNIILANSSIRANSTGIAETGFQFTVYGLPGTYSLTASGIGSDGRTYSASFDVTLGNISPPGNNEEEMACFGINKVKLHQYSDKNKYEFEKDKLYIKYATFALPDDVIVDLAEDDVSISIEGHVYNFPAGTLKQHKNKQHYTFKSAKGERPAVKFDLDFKKAKWNLKINKEDTRYIDNSDGVDISLSIGSYSGNENVILKSKNKHHDKFIYKRKPKLSCRIKNKHKDNNKHDDDSHEDDKDDDDDEDD